MPIRSIKDVKNLAGKHVLVRVDFNVPVKKGKVEHDFKIQKTLPTIRYLLSKGVKLILVSHLGRPQGVDVKLNLKPVAKQLEKLLGKSIQYHSTKIVTRSYFEKTKVAIEKMKPGEVIMLENIRFFSEERENKDSLAQELAGLADIFVSDCFGVTHHPAPSISGVTKYLPSYAGLLLLEEITILSEVMKKPQRPLVVVLGGAKVETKIPVLKYLLPRADYILVGGQIATTYLWAKGYSVGGSRVGEAWQGDILRYCSKKKVIVPVDFVVGTKDGKKTRVMEVNSLFKITDSRFSVYDIGPLTVRLFAHYIKQARTLVWNGAMGMFEQHPYEFGTFALADLFAARSRGRAFGVVGGGETGEVIQQRGLIEQIDLISTGGGAMLEFLSGKKLPGLEALKK